MADTKKKELTEEELEKVTGGQFDGNALLTLNGNNNGSSTSKGTATQNVLNTEQLAGVTAAGGKVTELTNRNGEAMNIAATGNVVISYVEGGQIYTTAFEVLKQVPIRL